ncbi:MAG: hypothetical protein A2289_10820 [Deltaproteobacteria bacterium RIFOXYA12_FULL_58_15]|nr:MAG: hypothetical protein A2289_10820 [Deltaproteobacteria bacterium RIFOXYA12_FULL_58_15]
MSATWQKRVDTLQRRIAGESDVGRRMYLVAQELCSQPYRADALVGGPELEEKLVIDLGSFDCVTFVESVLALGRSRTSQSFLRELTQLRYRNGEIRWRTRLHYFSDWLRANHRRGAIRVRTRGAGAQTISTHLGTLVALPERRIQLVVVPKANLHRAVSRISHGSVIAFASVRARLDFFHVGLAFWKDDALTLFHASRSLGQVASVPLSEFLSNNRMRGIAFAAPCVGTP